MKLTERQKELLQFVKDSHGDQKRKYTGEPYWNHVYSVAEIISEYDIKGIEIALCHDLFEDTDVQMPELLKFLTQSGYSNEEAQFIVNGVNDLTDIFTKENYPKLNRKDRKKLEAERLGKVNSLSQSVKYADLIDNTRSLSEHDKGFAKVYLSEKRQMLDQMRRGNCDLLLRCEKQVFEL
ncbi:MAG: HD domain-containing protein [Balneolaceae bacterium]